MLKCICEETRFNILDLLQKNKEMSVNDLVTRLQKGQPLVSHHLRALKQCNIIGSKENGKSTMYYFLNREISKVIGDIVRTGVMIATICDDPACCSC